MPPMPSRGRTPPTPPRGPPLGGLGPPPPPPPPPPRLLLLLPELDAELVPGDVEPPPTDGLELAMLPALPNEPPPDEPPPSDDTPKSPYAASTPRFWL